MANSGLTVELDAPKSQDLVKIMADIRAQYDELARKNREELDKYWSHQVQEGKRWTLAGPRGPGVAGGGRQKEGPEHHISCRLKRAPQWSPRRLLR